MSNRTSTTTIVTLIVCLVSLMSAACGDDDIGEQPGSCASLKRFYAEGCAITSGGQAISEASAALDCAAFRIEANTLGGSCPVAFDALYGCIGSIPASPTKGRCEACDAQLTAFKTCK